VAKSLHIVKLTGPSCCCTTVKNAKMYNDEIVVIIVVVVDYANVVDIRIHNQHLSNALCHHV